MSHRFLQVRDRASPPFSYILSLSGPLNISPKWDLKEEILPDGGIFYSAEERLKVVVEDPSNGAFVLLYGLSVDLNIDSLDMMQTARLLLAAAVRDDESVFKYADLIAGRYLVVFRSNNSATSKIFADACGTMKINYSHERRVVSSNIFLISGTEKDYQTDFIDEFVHNRELWRFGILGNLSPQRGVKSLTPNHCLDLGSFSVGRFYPRNTIVPRDDYRESVSKVLDLCQRQIRLLDKKYTLLVAITAGVDSRFSVAITQASSKNQRYFTFYLNPERHIDPAIGQDIARTLGLEHSILINSRSREQCGLNINYSKVVLAKHDPAGLEDVMSWDWYRSLPSAAMSYKSSLVPSIDTDLPVLHIRSNLYEIGRAFWGARHGTCTDASRVLKLVNPQWQRNFKDIFDNFFAETQFNNDAAMGLDLLDLFYWEHRCGTWVSEVIQTTDFAFNTHSYINCRAIIEEMLRVKFEDRVKGSLFDEITLKEAPKIRDIPINPSMY